MNIAFFTDTFLPKVDGIVTSILNTSCELLDRSHNVMIVAPRIRKNQEEIIKEYDSRLQPYLISGINALFYPEYRLTPPVSPWIVSKLKEFGADIVHFHTPFTMGMEAIIASRWMKLPLISTFHTYFCEPEYLKIVKLHWVPGLVKFGWVYSNFFHDRCDVTLSPSAFTARELERQNIKCPVQILSNGIPLKTPLKLTPEQIRDIKARYNLKNKVMLYIGRVSEEKCIDVLIKATEKVIKTNKDTCLLVVGGGPAETRLHQLVKARGMEDSIIFTGPVPNKELLASGLFEISRFFVTASTSENQPMTIIEACMFGLPLIGVNAKGVPEMIKENGFIAEPGDTEKIAEYMEKILNNDELQAEMSKKSRVIGKKYDIKRTTDSMLKLYTKLGQDKS